MLVLFVFVIGGLYGGLFTPTEAGGMGAIGALLIGVARGKLTRPDIRRSLLQAVRTAAAVLTVLIGALLFGYFLTVTQTPQKVTALLTGLGLGRYGVLALIMLMYLVLGCLMDALAMIILTIPIIFPVITQLGFDPIWFGVIIVMTVELGLIHPPVGMNVFVIKSVVQDVTLFDDLQGRAAVHRHRPHPPGDLDLVPDAGALFAVAHVESNCGYVKEQGVCDASPAPRRRVIALAPAAAAYARRRRAKRKQTRRSWRNFTKRLSTRRTSRRLPNSSARATSSTIPTPLTGRRGSRPS